jgi:hypothetical protein
MSEKGNVTIDPNYGNRSLISSTELELQREYVHKTPLFQTLIKC